jgi:hypothetical protein
MNKPLIQLVCVALLILLFTYTGVSKLLDHYRFVFQMRLSPLVPVKMAAPILGWVVPVLELAIGLLMEKWRRISLYVSLVLLSLFEVYIIAMLLSGIKLPCACGGVIAFMSWKQHVLFNACFIALNVFALVTTAKSSHGPAALSNTDNLSLE